jgi:hypothetical protein
MGQLWKVIFQEIHIPFAEKLLAKMTNVRTFVQNLLFKNSNKLISKTFESANVYMTLLQDILIKQREKKSAKISDFSRVLQGIRESSATLQGSIEKEMLSSWNSMVLIALSLSLSRNFPWTIQFSKLETFLQCYFHIFKTLFYKMNL